MLLNTKTMIPQVYAKERDIQVFTNLLDIILSSCKYDIDNLGDIYDPYRCPQSLLPLLAYTLNYQYNFSDTVTANRRVIGAFTLMEKYRGSEVGLKMAAALSLTSLDISKYNAELQNLNTDYLDALRELKVTYDFETGHIVIDYPNTYTLVRDLMDYVRPVGMFLEIRSVVGHNINTDVMLLYSDIESNTRQYIPNIDTHVEKSFVNFSGVADNNWIEQFNDIDYTLNLNN